MKINNRGFTLVELMIASGVFAVILLGASAALTQISRLYYKGIISSRTQNVSRSVMDEISRSIQFSSDEPIGTFDVDTNLGALCVGDTKYVYKINTKLDPSNDYVLWKEKSLTGNCDLAAPRDATNGSELSEGNMRLAAFNVSSAGRDLWNIDVKVIYGDDDLLNNLGEPNVTCKGGFTGTQWCAVSGLKTKVFKRVPTP